MKQTAFIISDNTLPQLVTKLKKSFLVTKQQHENFKIAFIDTFDWSLFKHDLILKHIHKTKDSDLVLSKHSNNQLISILPNPQPFHFSQELPDSGIKLHIQKASSSRALMVQLSLSCDSRQWDILNKNRKTIARVQLQTFSFINTNKESNFKTIKRLYISPIKGYEKETKRIQRRLFNSGYIQPAKNSILESALAELGRSTKEYNTNVSMKFDPEMDAILAMRAIFTKLLNIMEMNEHGILNEIDCEFLHDYRIAVRKTRSALWLVNRIFNQEKISHFRSEFSWLSQMTGPARDQDVHLIDFNNYRKMLPKNRRAAIEPLRNLVANERRLAYGALKKALKSQRYRKLKNDWHDFLILIGQYADPGSIKNNILTVANDCIWKTYEHTLEKGLLLCSESPSDDFHDERKQCKKLRYLLEFFRKLYPKQDVRHLIKILEDIQDELGDFQDLSVQEIQFQQFADQLMQREDIQSDTLLAMGMLLDHIEKEHRVVRSEFSDHFKTFSSKYNRKLFKNMFNPITETTDL